jgi:NAD(P)-dependent dehydrogenase (short-subunit alcohol dehydrogenase family)
MLKRLEGKTAVVTGGTEGIGLATARLFVKEGAYVFITGRRQKELDEAMKAIGSNVSGVQGDIAKLADLDRLYDTVSKVKGQLDIVFANAGVGEFVPFEAVTEDHFDKLFNINVRGTLFTVQKALPLLKDGGSIILNGSVASVKGAAAFGLYAASKAAIRRACFSRRKRENAARIRPRAGHFQTVLVGHFEAKRLDNPNTHDSYSFETTGQLTEAAASCRVRAC